MNIPSNLVKVLEILTFFIVWELLGRLRIVADGALPSVSEILLRFWEPNWSGKSIENRSRHAS